LAAEQAEEFAFWKDLAAMDPAAAVDSDFAAKRTPEQRAGRPPRPVAKRGEE